MGNDDIWIAGRQQLEEWPTMLKDSSTRFLTFDFFFTNQPHIGPWLTGSNNVDYFGEYEAIYETVLACESGP
jgi:hypothetical protein